MARLIMGHQYTLQRGGIRGENYNSQHYQTVLGHTLKLHGEGYNRTGDLQLPELPDCIRTYV